MLHRSRHQLTGRALNTPCAGGTQGSTDIGIGGVAPFSTMDCPHMLSSVFFLRGCPFRCPYCHNPSLQKKAGSGKTAEAVRTFLAQRAGFVETVVLSGGEPLMRLNDSVILAELARSLGFTVALHTTGFDRAALGTFLEAVRPVWVGLDMKAADTDYPMATGVQWNGFNQMRESLELLRERHIPVEVRTTVFQELACEDRLDRLVSTLWELKADQPVWQVMAADGRVDAGLRNRLRSYLESHGLTDRITLRG